jgi:hypothetical protein
MIAGYKGRDQWTTKRGNASWQQERTRGKLLPMDKPTLWQRVMGRGQ